MTSEGSGVGGAADVLHADKLLTGGKSPPADQQGGCFDEGRSTVLGERERAVGLPTFAGGVSTQSPTVRGDTPKPNTPQADPPACGFFRRS